METWNRCVFTHLQTLWLWLKFKLLLWKVCPINWICYRLMVSAEWPEWEFFGEDAWKISDHCNMFSVTFSVHNVFSTVLPVDLQPHECPSGALTGPSSQNMIVLKIDVSCMGGVIAKSTIRCVFFLIYFGCDFVVLSFLEKQTWLVLLFERWSLFYCLKIKFMFMMHRFW